MAIEREPRMTKKQDRIIIETQGGARIISAKCVYNLEFPPWINEVKIAGYRFWRHDEYEARVKRLQHATGLHAEFSIPASSGEHAITAYVDVPVEQQNSIVYPPESNRTALEDLLLLLSVFTGRDVFTVEQESHDGIIIADPRLYNDGILKCSIPYKEARGVSPGNIGFEEGLNEIYTLMRTPNWIKDYDGGHFLLLAKQAFKRQPIETAFINCWTIWEHLFTNLNRNWLSDTQLRDFDSTAKITFLLLRFGLYTDIDDKAREMIKGLTSARNRLSHYGRFTEREDIKNDAQLFCELTAVIMAKILGLTPSDVFNTTDRLKEFLHRAKQVKEPDGQAQGRLLGTTQNKPQQLNGGARKTRAK